MPRTSVETSTSPLLGVEASTSPRIEGQPEPSTDSEEMAANRIKQSASHKQQQPIPLLEFGNDLSSSASEDEDPGVTGTPPSSGSVIKEGAGPQQQKSALKQVSRSGGRMVAASASVNVGGEATPRSPRFPPSSPAPDQVRKQRSNTAITGDRENDEGGPLNPGAAITKSTSALDAPQPSDRRQFLTVDSLDAATSPHRGSNIQNPRETRGYVTSKLASSGVSTQSTTQFDSTTSPRVRLFFRFTFNCKDKDLLICF